MEAAKVEEDIRGLWLTFVAVLTACVGLIQRRSLLQKQINTLSKENGGYENQIAALRHQIQLTKDALMPYQDALRPSKD